jgi:hypothetical protein
MNIQDCLTTLRKRGRKGPVLVVPLDSLLQSFNSNTALPRALGKLVSSGGGKLDEFAPNAGQ